MTIPMPSLPAGWKQSRLRFMAAINPSKTEISHLDPSTEVSFVPMEAVGENASLDASRLKPISEVSSGYTYFRDGDILIAKITPCFENGKATLARGLTGGFGFGSTEFHVVRPSPRLDARFAFYVIRSNAFREYGAASMYGAGGQKRVPTDFVADYPVALPPLPDQRLIADFLDRETEKIDALIAKQEELIERIEEHGSAVVNHALTCGLNDSAPMKSARVDGNPQVPAHWPVLPLKYWATFLNNRRIPLSGEERASMVNKIYDYYGASGKIDLVEEFIFDEKTILIAEDGANLYSRSTPLAFIADGKYWVNNHAHILKPKDGLFELWVEILNRIDYTPYITGSAQPKLTIERLANIPFAAPVGEEAVALERFVRAESERTRPLMKQVRGMMERLIERRSALITAAVTGQIEVAANIGAEAAA